MAIKEKAIIPIVGLVHHGSGPRYTNLLDPGFASGLENFAGKVAEKFPWVQYYTPVNEPLTTSRFSGLYGLWYPHHSNDSSFVKMFLNQAKAIVLAMKAIRKINPDAKLVQTEDLGKTQSSAGLQYQADFENERRWLTFDLLCGRINAVHPLWDYLKRAGAMEDDLNFFIENTCEPDLLGINYYITSERYLDDNVDAYPKHMRGGNGFHDYVDIEAVRSPDCLQFGLKNLLEETWRRYQLPIAITEAHLNCTREEQMRWFNHIWQVARQAASGGIPVQAVTAWSLLGAYGWDSLLTGNQLNYESGVYKIIDNVPQQTALAHMIREIALTGEASHPLLQQKGWWERGSKASARDMSGCSGRPVRLICDEAIFINQFARICDYRQIPLEIVPGDNTGCLQQESKKPWAVIYIPGLQGDIFANTVSPNQNHILKKFVSAYKNESIQFLCFFSKFCEPANSFLEANKVTVVLLDDFRFGDELHWLWDHSLDLLIDKRYGVFDASSFPEPTGVTDIIGHEE